MCETTGENPISDKYLRSLIANNPNNFIEAVKQLHEAAQTLVNLCVTESLHAHDLTDSKAKLDHYRGQVSIAKGLKAHIEHNTRAMRAERKTWKR